MSAISMMELNTKSPFMWDWDNLVVSPSRAADVPKKLQLVESEFEGIDGFEFGSFHSSGGRSDVGSGGSASNLAHGSSSKSSKSASVDSSMNKEMRDSKFTLETSDCFSQNLSNRKELAGAWPTSAPSITEISIDSGEPLIGLKLGRRTYFEDVSGGKASTSIPASSCATVKKSKTSSQSTEIPRCQVEGCNLDLSSAKDYHRKHRVCENHSKSSKVIICGLERRFCQQCSRFHSLLEFDQKKRSCRRRLSDHNARRRKPKPEIIQFNPMRLQSSLHERRNQMSLAFNQVPMVQTKPNSNTTWDFTSNSKFTQEKFGLFAPTKAGGIDALHVTHNDPHETGSKLSYGSSQLLPHKSATAEVFDQGFPVSTTSTANMDAAQDLRALSLLSTNSWGSREPAPPLDQSGMLHNHHTRPLNLPPYSISGEYWQGEQVLDSPGPQAPTIEKNGSNNQFQEFQLFKATNEPSFYLYEDLR